MAVIRYFNPFSRSVPEILAAFFFFNLLRDQKGGEHKEKHRSG